MQKELRVFVDTSALLAGLNSPHGAAGAILTACFLHEIIPVISSQVIEEAKRNIPVKFPLLANPFASFLLIPPEITAAPSLKDIQRAYHLLPTNDAPILAAAINAQPDALITWNTHDFLRKEVISAVSFPILVPQQFLQRFIRDEGKNVP